MLIVFKLPALSRSCSKRIINIFQLSQLMDVTADGEFLDLYLKSVQENSAYKEHFVLKEK